MPIQIGNMLYAKRDAPYNIKAGHGYKLIGLCNKKNVLEISLDVNGETIRTKMNNFCESKADYLIYLMTTET